jgi:hypothetical protein
VQGQHLVEGHLVADAGLDLLDADLVADGYLLLFPTCLDDGVAHGGSPAISVLAWRRARDYSGGARGVSTAEIVAGNPSLRHPALRSPGTGPVSLRDASPDMDDRPSSGIFEGALIPALPA